MASSSVSWDLGIPISLREFEEIRWILPRQISGFESSPPATIATVEAASRSKSNRKASSIDRAGPPRNFSEDSQARQRIDDNMEETLGNVDSAHSVLS